MPDPNPEREPETPSVAIEARIHVIRGIRVLVDSDLARLYGVTTKRLNQQVRRNASRFPEDFAFRLTGEEKREVVTNCNHLRNLRYSNRLPLVFAEHGALMAAMVLNTERAAAMSVFVVRAFVRLRGVILAHRELAARVEELEQKVGSHDEALRALVAAIRGLLEPPTDPSPPRIGF